MDTGWTQGATEKRSLEKGIGSRLSIPKGDSVVLGDGAAIVLC